jgi:small conductance mechanosensitive channel
MEEMVGAELANAERFYNIVLDFAVNYGFQVLGAIIILIIGVWVAGRVGSAVTVLCGKKKVDPTLSSFAGSTVKIIILTGFIIISLGKFGISVTPFIAAIGAIGLGAGLAVQGLLANYSAGVAIILTRPFSLGNTITVSGVSGQVKDISLAATLLIAEDGELITIPNRHVVGEVMVNSFENRLVETTIGISYSDDPEQAIDIIRTVINTLDCVNEKDSTDIGISEFADSSVVIETRCKVATNSYYASKYLINGAIYKALIDQGVKIPFPQREVRVTQA